MKRTIIAVLLLISANSFAQTKPTRADSLQQIKVNKFIDSLNRLPVANFAEWLYENVAAKRRDEFIQLYNEYIKAKYEAWIKIVTN